MIRHLPISKEQSVIQEFAFEARKYVVAHYIQVFEIEH